MKENASLLVIRLVCLVWALKKINALSASHITALKKVNAHCFANLHAKLASLFFIIFKLKREKSTNCTSCISDDYTLSEETNECTFTGTCHSSCKTCKGGKEY